MKYYLFTPVEERLKDRWIIYLYENPETCVETWSYYPTSGLRVRNKHHKNMSYDYMSIDDQIFYFATTKHGMLKNPIWNYEEISETEAYFMMFDT